MRKPWASTLKVEPGAGLEPAGWGWRRPYQLSRILSRFLRAPRYLPPRMAGALGPGSRVATLWACGACFWLASARAGVHGGLPPPVYGWHKVGARGCRPPLRCRGMCSQPRTLRGDPSATAAFLRPRLCQPVGVDSDPTGDRRRRAGSAESWGPATGPDCLVTRCRPGRVMQRGGRTPCQQHRRGPRTPRLCHRDVPQAGHPPWRPS